MEEQFVPYELALKLKELGFDAEMKLNYQCLAGYNSIDRKFIFPADHNVDVGSPLWQQAFDWFREKHNLESYVVGVNFYHKKVKLGYYYSIDEFDKNEINTGSQYDSEQIESVGNFELYRNYQKARQACLEKLIEIVEKL